MSKLDWFTILIIAICVLAIGSLLYKTQNIIRGNDGNSTLEINESAREEEDATDEYTINYDGDGDGDDEASRDAATQNDGEKINTNNEENTSAEAKKREAQLEAEAKAESIRQQREAQKTTNTSPKGNSPTTTTSQKGDHLVLIGSYRQMISAERMQKLLRQKGYKNTSIQLFDNGKYARVLVGRKKTREEALDLQAELISDGFRDIIVQKNK